MNNLKYHISEAKYLVRQQKMSTLLMILSMVIMFLFLASVISAVFISGEIVKAVEAQAEIDVYYSDASDKAIMTRIQAMGDDIRVQSISQEAAYEKMANLLGDGENVLSYFEDNPFEAYIEVKVPIEEAQRLAGQFETINGVDYVRDNQTILSHIQSLSNTLTRAGIIILLGVGIGTFFIIAGMIRQSVYSYSDQIATMDLLGAPRRFIETPFYLEGVFLTVISGGISILIHFIWYRFVFASAVKGISMLEVPSGMDIFYKVALLTLGSALMVSLFGSYFGIKTSNT